MEDDQIRVEVSFDDGVAVIILAGELDAVSVATVQATFDNLEPSGRTVVQMTDVEFIDSTGLRVILDTAMRMCEQGGSLRIRRASTQVLRLLHITNLDGLLEKDAAA